MKVRRFVAAWVVAILVSLSIPASALAVTDAYGREYAGQAVCLGCHDGFAASDRTIYASTPHFNTVIDVRANPAKLVPAAASTTFWPSPGFGTTGLRFGPANVYLMFGSGTRKSFIGVPGEALPALSPVATVPLPSGTPADDLARFSGASFETETNTWDSTRATTVRSWYQSCGACHNTAVTRASIDTVQLASGAWMTPSTPSTATLLSIQCEACHGTGSSAVMHDGDTPAVLAWTSSNAAPGRLMSAEVCGQCHLDGETAERTFAGTGVFGQPNGYTPDESLGDYITLTNEVPTEEEFLADPDAYSFYPGGFNKDMHYGIYNEWLQNKADNGFGHVAPTNTRVTRDTKCLRCHSGEGFLEYIGDPIVPSAFDVAPANVKWGITCQVCHAPHDPTNGQAARRSSNPAIGRVGCSDCHNWQYEVLGQTPPTEETYEGGAAAVRVSHPQREMLAGTGLFGVLAAEEFMPGARCTSCHMPETAGEGQPSHRFHVMLPGKAEEWGVREEGDSCTPCHPSTSREDLQMWIDEHQAEVEGLLEEVTDGMADALVRMGWTGTESSFIATTSTDPDVVAYKKAYHNRMYVDGDSSGGIHNPPYAKAGLEYALYSIRTIGASLTLSGPSVGQSGMDITVLGTALMGDASPAPAGERIELQARPAGEADFATVALTDTNGLGVYSAVYRLTERTELRAVWMCEGTERISPVIEVAVGSYGGVTPVDRAWGEDRYRTAVEASKSFFGDGSVANVVLASGVSFADALSANGLAGVAGGPLLLTAPDALPTSTLTEIGRVATETTTTVWIVGGESAVGPAVASALEAAGYQVVRLAGDDRYHTARLAAAEVAAALGSAFEGKAFLANGRSFPDGLSVGPVAYANGMPVLLTEAGALPAGTSQAIADSGIDYVAVVGGTAAVSEAVLGALPEGSERVAAGVDRYATAIAFAEWAHAESLATYGLVGIASGAAFPDALAAGAPLGAEGGVLLLTQPAALPGEVDTFLTDNAADIGRVMVFGGTGAVSDAVRSAVYECVND